MGETSVSYKCPSCTAPLSYKPGDEKITCEFCGAEVSISTLEGVYNQQEKMAAAVDAARQAKWNTAEAGDQWSQQEAEMMKAYTCSSCGAEIVCDDNTMATECCYCGNPTMLPQRFDNGLKPDFVIPFKVTKEEAKAKLKEFYDGKKLLPNGFASQNRIESIQGMYVPFWLFDSGLTASATFEATRSRTYSSGSDDITETEHYRCDRSGYMRFEKVPCDGSEKMDDEYMESIEPYDYSEMVPFTTAYLAGYLADKYDVDAEASVPRADERVNQTAIDTLEETVVGYDDCTVGDNCVLKNENSVKYAMAPVWILSTKYQDKPYTFVMNAQTGKFVGSLPIDSNKANMWTIGTFIPAAILIYFIAKMFV